MKVLKFLVGISCVIISTIGASADAQTYLYARLGEQKLEPQIISQGETVTLPYTIVSKDEEQVVAIGVNDSIITDQGALTVASETLDNSFVPATEQVITLQEGQRISSQISFSPNPSARVGEYAVGLYLQGQPDPNRVGLQTVTRQALTTFLFIPGDDISYDSAITSATIIDPAQDAFDELQSKYPELGKQSLGLEIDVQNTGSFYTSILGEYTITTPQTTTDGVFRLFLEPNSRQEDIVVQTPATYVEGETEVFINWKAEPLNSELRNPSTPEWEEVASFVSEKTGEVSDSLIVSGDIPDSITTPLAVDESAVSISTKDTEKENTNSLALFATIGTLGALIIGYGALFALTRMKKNNNQPKNK